MTKSIEERLASVEKEVAVLKGEVKTLKPGCNWITSITGTFKDDPEFDEVLRLAEKSVTRNTPERVVRRSFWTRTTSASLHAPGSTTLLGNVKPDCPSDPSGSL